MPFAVILALMGCERSGNNVDVPSTQPAPAPVAHEEVSADTLPWKMASIDPAVMVFNTNDTLHTGVFEAKPLMQLEVPGGSTRYLLSGRSCSSCNEPTSLYILAAPADERTEQPPIPWHMPGRLFMANDSLLYYEASVFAGEVLPDTIGVIWYDRSLMPDGKWKQNTVLLNLSGPEPDTLVLFGHGRKSTTIDLAFHGKCTLLEDVDQHIRP